MKVVAFNRCTNPETFAELKPSGYWCSTLGYFVPVRMISDEEMAERIADREEWFEPIGKLKRPTNGSLLNVTR